MYINKKTGKALSDDELDQIVNSWTDVGYIGRPRDSIIAALEDKGFEWVDPEENGENSSG